MAYFQTLSRYDHYRGIEICVGVLDMIASRQVLLKVHPAVTLVRDQKATHSHHYLRSLHEVAVSLNNLAREMKSEHPNLLDQGLLSDNSVLLHATSWECDEDKRLEALRLVTQKLREAKKNAPHFWTNIEGVNPYSRFTSWDIMNEQTLLFRAGVIERDEIIKSPSFDEMLAQEADEEERRACSELLPEQSDPDYDEDSEPKLGDYWSENNN